MFWAIILEDSELLFETLQCGGFKIEEELERQLLLEMMRSGQVSPSIAKVIHSDERFAFLRVILPIKKTSITTDSELLITLWKKNLLHIWRGHF